MHIDLNFVFPLNFFYRLIIQKISLGIILLVKNYYVLEKKKYKRLSDE